METVPGRHSPGAMPWKNRYIGNPFSPLSEKFSSARKWGTSLRSPRLLQEAFQQMICEPRNGIRLGDVIKARLMGLKMTEVPTTSAPMAARVLRTCFLSRWLAASAFHAFVQPNCSFCIRAWLPCSPDWRWAACFLAGRFTSTVFGWVGHSCLLQHIRSCGVSGYSFLAALAHVCIQEGLYPKTAKIAVRTAYNSRTRLVIGAAILLPA